MSQTKTETPLTQLASLLGLPPDTQPDEIAVAALDRIKHPPRRERQFFRAGGHLVAVDRIDSVAPSQGRVTLQLHRDAYHVIHDHPDPLGLARQIADLVLTQPGADVVEYRPK